VANNDELPLKAARRNAIAKLKSFVSSHVSRIEAKFSFIYIRCVAPR